MVDSSYPYPSNSYTSKYQFSGHWSVANQSGVLISGRNISINVASGGFFSGTGASGGGQTISGVSIANVPTSESSHNH